LNSETLRLATDGPGLQIERIYWELPNGVRETAESGSELYLSFGILDSVTEQNGQIALRAGFRSSTMIWT
jgi:hypothetical protein